MRVKLIAKKYEAVSSVFLFGSRARGEAGAKSDYDLAVEWDDTTSIKGQSWGQFAEEVREGNPTLFSIDLVRISDVGPMLHERIKKEGKLIYEKNSTKL